MQVLPVELGGDVFITDVQLQGKVANALKRSGGATDISTSTFWPGIITDANAAAYNEIVTRLTGRGFSAAQIAAWDRGAEFQGYLGIVYALENGAALDGADDKWVEKMRKRYEGQLDNVQVLNGGAWQAPVAPQGTVGVGSLNDCQFPDLLDPDQPGDLDTGRIQW